MIYGLVGGKLTPANSGVLEVEIRISEDRSKRFKEAMIESEKVFVAMPHEYVPGIQSALGLAGKYVPDLTAGNLKLTHAAHGEVSSNQTIFGHLTISLPRLLSLDDPRPVEDEIVKIFPERLANVLT